MMLLFLPHAGHTGDPTSRCALHIAHFPATPRRADADDSAELKVILLTGLMLWLVVSPLLAEGPGQPRQKGKTERSEKPGWRFGKSTRWCRTAGTGEDF